MATVQDSFQAAVGTGVSSCGLFPDILNNLARHVATYGVYNV